MSSERHAGYRINQLLLHCCYPDTVPQSCIDKCTRQGVQVTDRNAPAAQVLILMRLLVGFSIGGLPVAFTLFTEFCPTAGRGAWLVVLQVLAGFHAWPQAFTILSNSCS